MTITPETSIRTSANSTVSDNSSNTVVVPIGAETFAEGYDALTEWFDHLPFPAGEIVLGGFSQGAVMGYALGLGKGRPRTRALIALSGRVPGTKPKSSSRKIPLT